MAQVHEPEQIARKLREAEDRLRGPSTVSQVAHELGISVATFYRWRRRYGGMRLQDARRIKELEEEVARLRKLVADQALDLDLLTEVNRRLLRLEDRPALKRKAVDHLQRVFRVSERRACRIMDQPRSSQRRGAGKAEWDRILSQRMAVLARQNPRYGYRRIWALLRDEGWAVNKKRVQRLWTEAGLQAAPERRNGGG